MARNMVRFDPFAELSRLERDFFENGMQGTRRTMLCAGGPSVRGRMSRASMQHAVRARAWVDGPSGLRRPRMPPPSPASR